MYLDLTVAEENSMDTSCISNSGENLNAADKLTTDNTTDNMYGGGKIDHGNYDITYHREVKKKQESFCSY